MVGDSGNCCTDLSVVSVGKNSEVCSNQLIGYWQPKLRGRAPYARGCKLESDGDAQYGRHSPVDSISSQRCFDWSEYSFNHDQNIKWSCVHPTHTA